MPPITYSILFWSNVFTPLPPQKSPYTSNTNSYSNSNSKYFGSNPWVCSKNNTKFKSNSRLQFPRKISTRGRSRDTRAREQLAPTFQCPNSESQFSSSHTHSQYFVPKTWAQQKKASDAIIACNFSENSARTVGVARCQILIKFSEHGRSRATRERG